QYRFDNGSTDLHGHSFGNLLIAAMLSITGDFEEAVRQTSRVLAIRGRVLPSTLRHVGLRAALLDGTVVEGETRVSGAQQPIEQAGLRVFDYVLVNDGRPSEELVRRYAETDAEPVYADVEKIRAMNFRPVVGDYISQTHVVRHDHEKLAQSILRLLNRRGPLG